MPIANRREEIETCLNIMNNNSPHRIIFIEGDPGSGRTTLLRELMDRCQDKDRIECIIIDLDEADQKTDYIYSEILDHLNERGYIQSKKRPERLHEIRRFCFSELQNIERIILFLIDNYPCIKSEHLNAEFKGSFLASAVSCENIRTVITGEKQPETSIKSGDWPKFCQPIPLEGIDKHKDWLEYIRQEDYYISKNIGFQ